MFILSWFSVKWKNRVSKLISLVNENGARFLAIHQQRQR